ncbi:AAA family ATPase [Pseudaeromonas sp. ZJS20]|uniref:AAA family ATPase n=1 Tax=Pseudaeromonas aegiceratis TaxID=3153928 RepID=UPI00390CA370
MVLRLHHLLEFSFPFILLSGPQGSGRTRVCELLLERLVAPWRTAFVTGSATTPLDELRESLIQQLVPHSVFDPHDTLGDNLFRLLGETPAQLLIVLDDADRLPEAFVDELWELASLNDALGRGHNKMGFVLTAPQPWCERLAARLKGREQPPVEMDMEPLSAAEQRTCLQYYLLRGNYPLDQGRWDALERLLSAVTGWPVELVALAEKTMSSKKSSFRAKPLPLNKWGATLAVVVAVVLLLSWIVPSMLRQAPTTSGDIAVPLPVPSAAEPAMPETAPLQHAVLPDEAGDGMTVDSQNYEGRRVVIADQVVQDIMAHQSGVSGATSSAAAPLPAVSGAVTSLQELTPVVEQIKQGEPVSSATATLVTQAKPVASQAVPVSQPVAPQTAKAAAVSQPLASKPPVTKAASGKPATAASLRVPNATLLSHAPRHYTIQLMASADANALARFVNQQHLAGQVWMYETQFKGAPWFVLIKGDYADSKQASQAIRQLSAELQKNRPWPKSFAQVHKELKQ